MGSQGRKRFDMRWSIVAWWRADRHYFRACRLARAGKPGEAVRAFDEVIAIFPKHARAHAQRALALAAASKVGQAVQAARRAAELDPGNHVPWLFLGKIQYDAGALEEARKAFSAASRLDPDNRLVQAYLGLALLAMGRTEAGAELLRPNLLYGYEPLEGRVTALAEQYLWEHRDRAKSLEDQLTADEGGRPEVSAGWGLRLASAVRRVLLWPLARLRGRAAALALEAEEAMSVGDWEQATEALHRAEQAGTDPEQVALALGQCYLEMDNSTAAVKQFARLPEETRKEPDVALLVGAALFDAGQFEMARKPLEIAAERFSREFVASYYRGLCDIALGQPKTAAAWFTQAAERLNPHIAKKRLAEMLRLCAEDGGEPR